MIAPYIRSTVRGWLPTALSTILSPQPVWYRQPDDSITGVPTYQVGEQYPFGAQVTVPYFSGPGYRPRGWTAVPGVTSTGTWEPAGGGPATTGPIETYFYVQPKTWDGLPPYPTLVDSLSTPVELSWQNVVGGRIVQIDAAPQVRVRLHTITNGTFLGNQAHTHDMIYDLLDRSATVDFKWRQGEFYNFYDPDHSGPESRNIRGEYFQWFDLFVGDTFVASFYPQGHPNEPAAAPVPTDEHENLFLLDWDLDIDIS